MTCLCLTRNRRHWLLKAIESYLRQTYLHRELLIVADGESVRDLLAGDAAEHGIRLIELDGQTHIGDKRNLGCERAAGEIIAHWDDDDYSAPDRLADQISRLAESGKAVTGYHSMRFVDTERDRWWLYRGNRNYSLGTSLCYRKDWWQANRFPSVQVGEDNAFAETAWAKGQLATTEAGEMMYATIHAGNTSPRMIGDNWLLLKS